MFIRKFWVLTGLHVSALLLSATGAQAQKGRRWGAPLLPPRPAQVFAGQTPWLGNPSAPFFVNQNPFGQQFGAPAFNTPAFGRNTNLGSGQQLRGNAFGSVGMTLEQARATLSSSPTWPQIQDVSQLSSEARSAWLVVHRAYLNQNPTLQTNHASWHTVNGASGGRQGPGSGVPFVGYHEGMMKAFEAFAGVAMPPWRGDVIPSEWPLDPQYGARTTEFPNIDVSGCGGTSLSLADNLDKAGRLMASTCHPLAHRAVGGPMRTPTNSVVDITFFGWHSYLSKVTLGGWYTQTPSGINWANANRGHVFFTGAMGSFMSRAPFMAESGCGGMSNDSLCATLADYDAQGAAQDATNG